MCTLFPNIDVLLDDASSSDPISRKDSLAFTSSDTSSHLPSRSDTIQIDIVQDSTPGCGGKIWEAAGILCRYVLLKASCDPGCFEGKRVLELGAGTGIVGICLAKAVGFQQSSSVDEDDQENRCVMGANRVEIVKSSVKSEECNRGLKQLVLTDLGILCPLMEKNVEANDMKKELHRNFIQVQALPWGVKPCPVRNHDVVLISDCVYLEACFEPLIDTLKDLVTHDTICWMSYKRRRRAEKRFFAMLRKHFNVEQVQ
jgi:predicted nicotinamide N-methyase